MKSKNLYPLRGQTLVEFALVIPILLLLAVVIFDLGRGVYYYSAIHNAAREGARYGVIHPNDTAIMEETAASYAIGLGITPFDVTANWIQDDINGNEAYIVKVSINYCFVPVTPMTDVFMSACDPITDPCCDNNCNDLLLCSEAIMRTEAKPSD